MFEIYDCTRVFQWAGQVRGHLAGWEPLMLLLLALKPLWEGAEGKCEEKKGKTGQEREV